MLMDRCPRAMLESEKTVNLLQYCYHYLDYGKFPDGRGIMYQPIVLLDALNVFVNFFRQYEKNDYERKMKELQNGQ